MWKMLIRYGLTPARPLILALLLVFGVPLAAWPAEPGGATVVLQLPPSVSPEAVRKLIADLAAKGAQPASGPADLPTPDLPPSLTTAGLAARVGDAVERAIQAVPALRQTLQIWTERVEADGGTRGAALGFWVVALAGLVAAPLIGWAVRSLFDRRQAGVSEPGLAPRLRAAIIRLLVAVASLAAFGILFWAALFCVSSGHPILEETADRLVWAALVWRFSIVALLIVLSPTGPTFGCWRSTVLTRGSVFGGSGSIC